MRNKLEACRAEPEWMAEQLLTRNKDLQVEVEVDENMQDCQAVRGRKKEITRFRRLITHFRYRIE